MTTTSYLGGTVDQVYNQTSFDWLKTLEQQAAISLVALKLGVSAGALVGAMAEENTSYLASETSQWLFDQYALSSLDPAAFAAALAIGISTAEVLVTAALIIPRTHEQFLADYEALRAADQLDEHGLDAKVLHPALADLGPANFKLATAITLLNDYLCSSSNADDPLGLSDYASHYDQLATDLTDSNSQTAAKLYGLMLQKAERWFTDADSGHCAYAGQWQDLPQAFRDALLVSYVNVGEKKMLELWQTSTAGGTKPYEPQPLLTTGAGMNHLLNAAAIGAVAGVAGYGQDIASASDFSAAALGSAADAIAYRYALVNLRYVALPSLDYSSRNQQGELDLYDPVTGLGALTDSYIQDRTAMLSQLVEVQFAAGQTITDLTVNDGWNYRDFASGKEVLVLPDPFVAFQPLVHRVYFGGDAADTLEGQKGSDRLYGMGGDDTLKGEAGNDYLEGGTGNDNLDGGANNDTLLGMSGNDTLIGGQGNDVLNGGIGNDRYEFHSGDGFDQIIDSGGQGSLWLDGAPLTGGKEVLAGAGTWGSEDGKVTYALLSNADQTQSLYIQYGNSLIQVNNFVPGQLGITLANGDALPPATEPTLVGDKKPIDMDVTEPGDQYGYDALGNVLTIDAIEVRKDVLCGGADNDVMQGLGEDDILDGAAGNDTLEGSAGKDRLNGQGDNDLLIGGEDADILIGAEGDDRLYASTQGGVESVRQQTQGSGLKGDWLTGGLGEDVVVGDVGNDVLLGGGGKDTLWGGAGDDVLNGDENQVPFGNWWQPGFDWSINDYGNPFDLQFINAYTLEVSTGIGDNDILYGGAGNDRLSGLQGNDWLFGELGQDTLSGDDGNDRLFGGDNNDLLTGDYGKYAYDNGVGLVQQGNDTLDGGAGNDWLQGEGGDDLLIGGGDNDTLTGDAGYLAGVDHGNDHLEGGLGDDRVFGQGGNDVLYGGEDNDLLAGDDVESLLAGQFHGKDTLYGGAGLDSLIGGGGDDELHGGSEDDQLVGDAISSELSATFHGNDRLYGDNGNDSLQGLGGADTLVGGAGRDVLDGGADDDLLDGGVGNDFLDGGAGNDRFLFNVGDGVDVAQDEGGQNIVQFGAGISFGSLKIDVLSISGVDSLRLADGLGDALLLANYTTWTQAQFHFADGSRLNFAELMQRLSNALNQAGSANADMLYGGNFNDTLLGANGDDFFRGQAGNDRLVGGAGNDRYFFSVGDGADIIDDTEGENIVSFGERIASSSLSFKEIYSSVGGRYLLVSYEGGSVAIKDAVWGAVSAFTFADGSSLSFGDALRHLPGLNLEAAETGSRLYGSDGDDQFIGGAGMDRLEAQAGNDSLNGNEGNDTLLGGTGNDSLIGGSGHDLLYGGDGDDYLSGGKGDDTLSGGQGTNRYQLHLEMGQDIITRGEEAGENIIQLSSDIDNVDLWSRQDGDDLVIGIKGSDSKFVIDGYYSSMQNWSISHGGEKIASSEFLQALDANSAPSLAQFERQYKRELYAQYGEFWEEIYGAADTGNGTYQVQDVRDGRYSRYDTTRTFSLEYSDVYVDENSPWINQEKGWDGAEWEVYSVSGYVDSDREQIEYSRTLIGSLYGSSGSSNDIVYRGSTTEFYVPAGGDISSTYGAMTVQVLNEYDKVVGYWVYPTGSVGQFSGLSYKEFSKSNDLNVVGVSVAHGGDSSLSVRIDEENMFYGGMSGDFIYGSPPSNGQSSIGAFLSGGGGDDYIYGGKGRDYIIGGTGNDFMNGHEGDDLYVIAADGGIDVIADSPNLYKVYNPAQLTASGLNDVVVLPGEVKKSDLRLEWGTVLAKGYHWRGYGSFQVDLLGQENSAILMFASLDISWGTNQKVRIVMPRNEDPKGSGIDYIQLLNGEKLSLSQIIQLGNLGEIPDPYVDGGHVVGSFNPRAPIAQWSTPLVGGEGNDIIESSYDYIDGAAGDDLIIASGGSAYILGGTGNDRLLGGSGDDEIVGDNGNDILSGGGGDDILDGLDGNDILNGGLGADELFGGAGDDIYVVDNLDDVVTEDLDEGTDTVKSSLNWALGDNLENLMLTGSQAIDGTGNAGNNTLTGNSANNVLSGGAGNDILNGSLGADQLFGGVGNDTYVVDNLGSVVTELLDEGTDTVKSSFNWALGDNLENLTLTGSLAINGTGNAGNNRLTGNSGNNVLSGGAGNDILNGGLGTDQLFGGAGNDTYVVDNFADVVTELLDEGTDTVKSSLGWALDDNLENLTLTGSQAIDGTGNAGNNALTGNSANNLLSGGAGNDVLNGGLGTDQLFGGAGNDTYVVDNASDAVTEQLDEGTDTIKSAVSWGLGNNLENLTLTGSLAIDGIGNAGNNTLTGNSANNVLSGGAGNDILNGALGADQLCGGTGNDTYVVDNLGDLVTELLDEGTDTVKSSFNWALGDNLENLTLTGSLAIDGTGNAGNNTLTGNSANNVLSGSAGNDILNGGLGADQLIGGAGNDIYVVDEFGDVVTESLDEGADTIKSAVSWTLGDNLENLTLAGSLAVDGTGNAGNNVLTGNAVDNRLAGTAGNDTLKGGAGNDSYLFGRGDGLDKIVENDATIGNSDQAWFGADISQEQLWFRHAGNNLEVSVIGTGDQLIVQNWYLGSQYHVEEFKTADGKTLLDSQVQNLVNAMAAFAPPAAGETSLSPNYHAALDSVIAANWQ